MIVGTCNQCGGEAVLHRQGDVVHVMCGCGRAKIPAAFFARAGKSQRSPGTPADVVPIDVARRRAGSTGPRVA